MASHDFFSEPRDTAADSNDPNAACISPWFSAARSEILWQLIEIFGGFVCGHSTALDKFELELLRTSPHKVHLLLKLIRTSTKTQKRAGGDENSRLQAPKQNPQNALEEAWRHRSWSLQDLSDFSCQSEDPKLEAVRKSSEIKSRAI